MKPDFRHKTQDAGVQVSSAWCILHLPPLRDQLSLSVDVLVLSIQLLHLPLELPPHLFLPLHNLLVLWVEVGGWCMCICVYLYSAMWVYEHVVMCVCALV